MEDRCKRSQVKAKWNFINIYVTCLKLYPQNAEINIRKQINEFGTIEQK